MSGPSTAALRRLLVASPDALIVARTGGEIAFASDRAGDLFGWTPDALVGVQLDVLLSAEPDGSPRCARRRDGTSFPAEVSTSVVDDICDETFTLLAVRDVSAREDDAERFARDPEAAAVRRQLEQAQHLESLGQLASGVAHDFNNLIGVIMNYTTLIARRIDDPAVLADVAEIDAAAERAAGLTRQVLSFANGSDAEPEPVELNQVVQGVASMLHRTLGEHIELALALLPSPLVVTADRHQLEQIVLNLVINARDAMVDGGTITVGTTRTGDHATLWVRDTGSGMTPEVAARAFEPYFTTKGEGGGTGLGLATVARIVRRSGGKVSLVSEVGRGTAVTVTLRGGHLGLVAGGADAPHRASGGRHTILLAEDDDALRVGTARLLEDEGYRVVIAADGDEALALVRSGADHVDLVFADVTSPGATAEELVARLQGEQPDLPVLFVTGDAPGSEGGAGRHVLRKPVSEDVLLDAIREVLDAR